MIRWIMAYLATLLFISNENQVHGFVSICSNPSWNQTGITIAGQTYSMTFCGTVFNYGLCQPMGAAMDSNQNVYVADYLNNRIQKWALNWSYQSPQTVAGQASGASGSGPSYLDDPTAVSLDAGGNVYALDQSNGRVQKWTAGATSGTTVAGSGLGSALFELNVPWGMYVEPSTATIYVADSGNNRVMKYVPGSATGTAVAGNSSGYLGVAANLLEFPWSVVVDSAGTIYVSDTHNNRVQKFVSGSLVGVTVAGQASGVSGSSSMDLNFPKTVMLDAGGQLYVLDYGNQRIQRFSPNNMTGTTIFSWCSGTAPDQIGRASHMTFDTFGNLIITDDENYRVQKYLLTCGGNAITTFPVCSTTTAVSTTTLTIGSTVSHNVTSIATTFPPTSGCVLIELVLFLFTFHSI